MFDVISFGSAILDTFIKSPDLKVIKTNEFSTSEALAAPHGTKCRVDQLTVTTGGGGTNTAVGFARLGLQAAVVARCGWDNAGKLIRKELQRENVDDSLLIQLEQEQTDQSFILIGPDGKSTLLIYRGKTRLEKRLIDFKKLKTKWFCLSNLEGNIELLKTLVKFAKKNKIKVAINPGRREIEQREKVLPIISDIDLLVVNKKEANELFARATPNSKGLIAVTKGEDGAVLYGKKRLLKSDGFKIEMVDSTGAGDGFFCGLVAGLIKGWSLEKALKLGVCNGAAAVTEIGAKTGLLFKKNVHNWLAKPLKMTTSLLP